MFPSTVADRPTAVVSPLARKRTFNMGIEPPRTLAVDANSADGFAPPPLSRGSPARGVFRLPTARAAEPFGHGFTKHGVAQRRRAMHFEFGKHLD